MVLALNPSKKSKSCNEPVIVKDFCVALLIPRPVDKCFDVQMTVTRFPEAGGPSPADACK